MLDYVSIFLLFLAFCMCNFLFNVLWEVVKSKMQLKFTDDKIDTIYAALIRKLLSIRSDLNMKGGKDNEV